MKKLSSNLPETTTSDVQSWQQSCVGCTVTFALLRDPPEIVSGQNTCKREKCAKSDHHSLKLCEVEIAVEHFKSVDEAE